MKIRFGSRIVSIRPIVVIIVIVAASILARLGFWQLERADQKRMRLEQIAQQSKYSPMTLSQILAFDGETQDLPVNVSAEFDPSKVFLLDNKIHKGRPGFQVIQVAKESSSGLMFLVNVGWIAGTGYRDKLPEFEPIAGVKEFNGLITIPQPQFALADDNYGTQWPTVIQQVNVKKMSTHYGKNVLSEMVLLDESVGFGFVRNWQPVVMPPEKHQAYALQWFLLAVCTIAVSLAAATKRSKKNNNTEKGDS